MANPRPRAGATQLRRHRARKGARRYKSVTGQTRPSKQGCKWPCVVTDHGAYSIHGRGRVSLMGIRTELPVRIDLPDLSRLHVQRGQPPAAHTIRVDVDEVTQ